MTVWILWPVFTAIDEGIEVEASTSSTEDTGVSDDVIKENATQEDEIEVSEQAESSKHFNTFVTTVRIASYKIVLFSIIIFIAFFYKVSLQDPCLVYNESFPFLLKSYVSLYRKFAS